MAERAITPANVPKTYAELKRGAISLRAGTVARPGVASGNDSALSNRSNVGKLTP